MSFIAPSTWTTGEIVTRLIQVAVYADLRSDVARVAFRLTACSCGAERLGDGRSHDVPHWRSCAKIVAADRAEFSAGAGY